MDKVQKIREEIQKIARSINPYIPDEEGKNSEYETGRFAMVTQIMQIIDSLQEDPVSEDLEKASKEWLRPQLDKSYANYGEKKMMELTHFDGYAMLDAIEFGAKWQKEQIEKNRLAHCDKQTKEEAEKDLELTWKDMLLLADIEQDVFNHSDSPLKGVQAAYEEVLKRFKANKQ